MGVPATMVPSSSIQGNVCAPGLEGVGGIIRSPRLRSVVHAGQVTSRWSSSLWHHVHDDARGYQDREDHDHGLRVEVEVDHKADVLVIGGVSTFNDEM